MAGMELIVANPVGEGNLIWQHIKLHVVLVASAHPFLDGKVVIQLEGIKVSRPHGASRVIGPTYRGIGVLGELERAVDELHGFNTLLA